VVLQFVAQFLFLGHQLVDLSENVLVLSHRSSLPDYRELVTSNAGQKPEIEFPDGPAPTEMVIKDLVVGDGAEAVPGGNVEVHYVGVEYDTGEEFDSSWNRGESIEFPLRGLIQGWQDGIPGMMVGGRRQLTIPPEQAYGPAGGGHRLSGKTLVFVIDLLGVR
jgi:peptidylprolyl isomerase